MDREASPPESEAATEMSIENLEAGTPFRPVARVHAWRRCQELQVLHPTAVPYSAQIKRLMAWQSRGQSQAAYEMAIQLWRQALDKGMETRARRMADWITSLQESAPTPLKRRGQAERLEDIARRAVRQDDWMEARDATYELISMESLDVDAKLRIWKNQAMILYTLGRFSESAQVYDQILERTDFQALLKPVHRAALRLSGAAARFYTHELTLASFRDATPYLGYNATLWQLYWWLMGHASWDNHQRLGHIRRASIRSFNPDWEWMMDRLLWGLDLHLGWEDQAAYQIKRLDQALDDPQTVRLIGRSGWLDLAADGVRVLTARRAPGALALWQQMHDWCAEHRLDGWVAYWEANRP